MAGLVVRVLEVAQDRYCTFDRLPIPVVQFYLVLGASPEWAAYGATFGKVVTKKQTIFGYTLHLLSTLNGVILDFVLAPAYATNLTMSEELLLEHTNRVVLGDKGYMSEPLATRLTDTNRLHRLTIPRRNEKRQVPMAVAHWLNARRQIIETVNGQLTGQCGITTQHAHSFWGVCAVVNQAGSAYLVHLSQSAARKSSLLADQAPGLSDLAQRHGSTDKCLKEKANLYD